MTFWAHCSHIKSDWSSFWVCRGLKNMTWSLLKLEAFSGLGWYLDGQEEEEEGVPIKYIQALEAATVGAAWCSMVQHGAAWWPNHLSFLTSISLLAEDFELSAGQAEDSWTVNFALSPCRFRFGWHLYTSLMRTVSSSLEVLRRKREISSLVECIICKFVLIWQVKSPAEALQNEGLWGSCRAV